MNEDLFILMLNITLYVTTFLFLLRYKVWNIGTLVWALFTISHIGSFFYYFIALFLLSCSYSLLSSNSKNPFLSG